MDDTSTRQQRYRDKLQSEGQRQRVFFLSDAAMAQLKKRKVTTGSPSLNHALEALLKDMPKVIAQVKRFAAQLEIVTGQDNPSLDERVQYLYELGQMRKLAEKI